jgi:hypothetical protein
MVDQRAGHAVKQVCNLLVGKLNAIAPACADNTKVFLFIHPS